MYVCAGNHVIRQARTKLCTHCFGIKLDAVNITHHIGDQTQLASAVLTSDDHCITHAVASTQGSLDFSELDTETAQLNLIVIATEELQRAVGAPAHQIATAVHALTRLLSERIRHETFGRQIRTAKIATRQTMTSDIQFTRYAMWAKLSAHIEHVNSHTSKRKPERNAVFIATQRVHETTHCGFSRAVVVEDLRAWRALPPPAHSIDRRCFAAEHQHSHASVQQGIAKFLLQQHQMRGSELEWSNGAPLPQCMRPICRCTVMCAQLHGTAAQQRRINPGQSQIEVQRSKDQRGIAWLQGAAFAQCRSVSDQPLVGDHCRLGLAGGTGGVHHIGQMLPLQPRDIGIVRGTLDEREIG